MKKQILFLGVVALLMIMLITLTGCGEEKEVKVNNTISNVSNKKENTNKIQNKVKNETNTSNNENKQTNQVKETNTTKNENQSVTKNETAETTQKKTFNIGNYVFHYGNYSGRSSKLIDTSMTFANITINLKEDGTYTYDSSNQEVRKNRSGTYEIKGNTIVLNDSEPIELNCYRR